jgi:hypothetical protein
MVLIARLGMAWHGMATLPLSNISFSCSGVICIVFFYWSGEMGRLDGKVALITGAGRYRTTQNYPRPTDRT